MSAPGVLVMAGGTGGHVFPALAVATALRGRGITVTWMGTRTGLEARLVPEAGFPIEWVDVGGVRGKGFATRLAAPLRIARAVSHAAGVIRRVDPAMVLGMGGFASGPGGLAAWLTRRPLVVHEQNAVAGMTNRVLARFAASVLEAFPGSFPAPIRARAVGNPVRPEIAALPAPAERMAGRDGPVRLLVLGGSQGALRINQLMPEALAGMDPSIRPVVRHQAGALHHEKAAAAYAAAGVEADVQPFLSDMAEAYGWADLVLCRSGALTVSELAAAGLGSVLIPFPAAVDDHQTLNARYLVDPGAALLAPEHTLDPERVRGLLEPLVSDRTRLLEMAAIARSVARPSALAEIEQTCLDAGRLEAGRG
jgi:UDP-N-acetylglucosamine--N-acetylmuramyl-(pentapeptide) pyrophosphoryl-undecaprenol N-acetylglucosamine transferase